MVSIRDTDIVLDMSSMFTLIEFTISVHNIDMRFNSDSISNGGNRVASFKRMKILIHHDEVEWET